MSSTEVATRLGGESGPRCGASLLADAPHRLVTPHPSWTRSRVTASASAIELAVEEPTSMDRARDVPSASHDATTCILEDLEERQAARAVRPGFEVRHSGSSTDS